ncbi:hypothetical protein M3201_03475 [Paenibacillus motobuensis]|nr:MULTISPECIES: hypothetical protein [Paenibacillus]MCM3038761.1 hypothetical protein [Paenibacillus lutimineralis]MCM3645865.1 hypothetical protein [Paenibacillus motobuensis]
MIVLLLLIRLTVILGVTAFYDTSTLTDTLIDSIGHLNLCRFHYTGHTNKEKE